MLEMLIVGAALGIGLFLYLTWSHDIWRKAGVPGPKPSVFFGNTPSMLRQTCNTLYEYDDIYRDFKKSGARFAGVFQLREPRLLLIAPDLVKDVLIGKFNSFQENEYGDWLNVEADPLLAGNPLLLSGDKWKKTRDEISPAFTSARIKALSPLISDISKTMVNYINKQIDKNVGPIETKELSAKYTTDIVSNCIFAINANSFDEAENKAGIREMGRRLMAPSFKMMFYIMAVAIFPIIKKLYKIKVVPHDIEKFFTTLMANAEKYRHESNISRDDYLDHLLQLKRDKGISNMDMAAHGVTFFIDGFETTSIAQGGCLYLLGRNKDVQTRLRNEIKENLENDGSITTEKVLELKYLGQVLAESLRLYPPTMMLNKVCTETVELDGIKEHKLKLGKGKIVIVPVYSIHRDPEYYPEPEKFDPERFSLSNGGTKVYEDKGVYFPFGLGPRMCLGQRFGIAQVKLGIAEIIRNFEVSVDSKTPDPIIVESNDFSFFAQENLWLNYKKL